MSSSGDILVQIKSLHTQIRLKYPELYAFLNEDPMSLTSEKYPDVSKKMLKNYLENLQELMKTCSEKHLKS
jgi:hypothetical protein